MNSEASDWDDISVADLGEIVAGGTPSRSTPSFWNGTIHWVTPGEITELKGKYVRDTREKITEQGLAASAARLLPPGSVLVTSRATLGEAAIAAVPVATNQGFKNIIPNDQTHPVFAYYLMRTLRPEMERLASGTTFLEISKSDFARIRARRPDPQAQARIAFALETVDEAIAKIEAVIAKAKQLCAGLLHNLLTRGINENGELRDPVVHPEQFKNSPLGFVPKEWQVPRIGDEVEIEHGFAFDGRFFADKAVGPRLLVPGNFHRDGGLYFDESNTKYYTGSFPERTVLSNGDILIVMTDLSPQTLILGRTVLLNEPFRLLHNQRIGKFCLKRPEAWDPAFFAELMNDDRLRGKVIREATGTTVRHTSPERIKSGFALMPTPDEQVLIRKSIETVRRYIQAAVQENAKLSAIKLGLMSDVLAGRVPVPESVLSGEAHA